MLKLKPALAALTVLMIAALACSTSSVAAPAPDPNAINTSVAQTLLAIQGQGGPATVTLISPPTSTFTPQPPTASPTVTDTPTPVFTFTPAIPLISVSIDTNCRVGPGKAFERIGALLVGQYAEVYGRDPAGTYWYIRNPDSQNGYCWLWGEYATLTGNTGALPIFTPPPTATPAPGFNVSFASLENCATSWFVNVDMENTGSITFRSISMIVQDLDGNATMFSKNNVFGSADGCNQSSSKNTLGPGIKMVVSSPSFSYNLGGHKLRATITVCSEENLNGYCVTKEVVLKP